jgi:hypothetical protein
LQYEKDRRDAEAANMPVEEVVRIKAYFRAVGERLQRGTSTDIVLAAMRAQKDTLLKNAQSGISANVCATLIYSREILGRRS